MILEFHYILENHIVYLGGGIGLLLTVVAYYITRPTPEIPLVPLHMQSPLLPVRLEFPTQALQNIQKIVQMKIHFVIKLIQHRLALISAYNYCSSL